MTVDVERLQFFDPETGARIADEAPVAEAIPQPAAEQAADTA